MKQLKEDEEDEMPEITPDDEGQPTTVDKVENENYNPEGQANADEKKPEEAEP